MTTQFKTDSDVTKPKKSNTVTGVITFILLIAAIGVMAFAVYLKSIGYDFKNLSIESALNYVKDYTQSSSSKSKEDITFSQDGTVDYKVYRGYIILLSQDGMKWFDKSGKLIQEKALTLTRPVLRTSKKYMAVIDISGRDIYMFKDKTQLWTRKLDNQIINAEVNDEGNCTIVTQSKEFKSAVLVIDVNGAEQYKKYCAQNIVMSAKELDDGETVLINKVITKGIKAGTQFEFNNIYEDKPFAVTDIVENLFPVILEMGQNIVATGQNMVLCTDKQGKELWRKKSDSVYCVAQGSDKYIIVAGKFSDSTEAANQKVLVLNSKGEEVYGFEQPEKISGISMYEDKLLLRTQRSIYLYSLKGKKLGQYIARNEIKDAYLTGDNEAVVITGGNISLVEIK